MAFLKINQYSVDRKVADNRMLLLQLNIDEILSYEENIPDCLLDNQSDRVLFEFYTVCLVHLQSGGSSPLRMALDFLQSMV